MIFTDYLLVLFNLGAFFYVYKLPGIDEQKIRVVIQREHFFDNTKLTEIQAVKVFLFLINFFE